MLSEVVRSLWTAGGAIYGVFANKAESEKIYRFVVPELKSKLEGNGSMADDDVKKAIEILKELPAFGAKRRNFEQKYLTERHSILTLPDDPTKIPFGYWH